MTTEPPIALEEMADTAQAKILKAARERLDITTEELAEQLGVALPTMRGWLLPTSSKAHRAMPKTAKLLLERIMKDKPRKKR